MGGNTASLAQNHHGATSFQRAASDVDGNQLGGLSTTE